MEASSGNLAQRFRALEISQQFANMGCAIEKHLLSCVHFFLICTLPSPSTNHPTNQSSIYRDAFAGLASRAPNSIVTIRTPKVLDTAFSQSGPIPISFFSFSSASRHVPSIFTFIAFPFSVTTPNHNQSFSSFLFLFCFCNPPLNSQVLTFFAFYFPFSSISRFGLAHTFSPLSMECQPCPRALTSISRYPLPSIPLISFSF